MEYMSLDIETYSSVDLRKCSVYRYAESPDADVLLFSYSLDGGPVKAVDVACGEEIPDEVLAALSDDSVIKWAFNASFERVFLSIWLGRHYPRYFSSYGIAGDTVGRYLDPASWRCSLVWCACMGLPLSLEGAGAVLGLDEQKMSEGKDLIRYFCRPCAPTKTNGGRTRNLPEHAPDKWETFKRYNVRDVEVEMSIQDKLSRFPVADFIWEQYALDQEINDRGIAVDMELVGNAIMFDEMSRSQITKSMKEKTGVDNPNSVQQMTEWLSDNGVETGSLDKKAVAGLITTAPPDVAEVLRLRQRLARSSIKKYQAMQNAVCSDGRERGMFQFYGANRTGRWAGRIIQLQNLPRNSLPDLEQARSVVKSGDYEFMDMLYDDVPDTLSQLIRTAFVPRPGYKLVVADFSSIEARVLSFIAGEQWRIDAFAEGKDIYCMSASQMFGVPVEKHGQNSDLRQKGKIAELACIAEGQPVLTDKGLIPIEKVTTDEKVWDGENWVEHGGVVYKGKREVITYDGLTATADHLVYVDSQCLPVRLGDAAQSVLRLRKNDRSAHYDGFCRGSAPVYDILNAGPNHRFTVSGKLVHNCGYGGSVGALTKMGALDMGLEKDELQPLVNAWRSSNPHIVRLWWDVDSAVKTAVSRRTTTETHGMRFRYRSGMLFIDLPSGRSLVYVKPRIGVNRFGGESITYEGVGTTKKWERIESYGPKFVENCLSGDTLVLTDKGLIPISEVTEDEKVWDGEEWVSHNGVAGRGMQKTMAIGGIRMTPEHKILTEKGWVECVKAEGLDWAAVSLPDGLGTGSKYKTRESTMAVPMRMWQDRCGFRSAFNCKKISREILRVHDGRSDQCIKENTWDESPSGLRGVALNEAEMRGSEPPGISQLRRTGDYGLPGMEHEFRDVLEGHGSHVSEGAGSGSDRQQPGIPSGKLQMGDQKSKYAKQEEQQDHSNAVRQNDCCGSVRTDRYRSDDDPLSAGTQLADRISVRSSGLSEPVYDIRNCGPRHRFAVYDRESGALRIVSNCTQSICRDILAYAMQTLRYCFIVGHVHDELIIECSKDVSVEALCEQMGRTPPWMPGLEIRADGFETMFYKKD